VISGRHRTTVVRNIARFCMRPVTGRRRRSIGLGSRGYGMCVPRQLRPDYPDRCPLSARGE
jgi:hypothetical protein